MDWTTGELRQFKKILQAASAPLAFDSIESFSRAVFDPVLSLTGGQGGQLYITDRRVRKRPVFFHHTYDDRFSSDYRTRFFRESPLHRVLRQGNPERRAFDVASVVDYDDLTRTEFYHEFLKPRGIHHMAGFASRIPSTGTMVMLGVQRRKDQEPFSEADLELLDLLRAPTEGAVRTLLLAEQTGEHLEKVFERFPVGVFVLDWDLKPVFRNSRVSEILEGVELSPDETAALHQEAEMAKRAFVAGSNDDPASGLGSLQLLRGDRRISVRVSVLPEGIVGGRRFLLCLFEARGIAKPENARRSLTSFSGLTDREAEIAVHCAEGKTNRQISRQLGVSAETIKYHLKNIFQKLGVTRRTELASIVSRL